ncbi:MAG TPA: hypothetical protein VLA93_12610 [Pyrinomonadaceae bacterium]|nr:hypothetical protein [Pyrinomonadaceae bacterium]
MSRIIALLLCVLFAARSFAHEPHREELPASIRQILNRRFPGWKFVDVSEEVQQFLKQEMNGASPVVVKGDFDGNHRIDYAVLIRHGDLWYQGEVIGPRHLLVVFLRKAAGYKVHVIKEPDGQYIGLAKKGSHDYNYSAQKEITYVNDSIMTVIPEKAGSSYVYWKGRFYSFVSGD